MPPRQFVAILGFVLCGALTARPADPLTPLQTFAGHTETVYAVAVSPDGTHAATGSFDRTIKLWDLTSGKEVRTFATSGGHQGLVLFITFSPDGKLLASGGADNTAKLWDPADGSVKGSLAHPNLVDAVAFDPTGERLATACHDGIVRIWNVERKEAVKQISAHTQPQANPVYAVTWTPDGKQLISASFDRSIKVWDVESGNLVREIPPGSDRPPLPAAVGAAGPGVLGGAGGWMLTQPPPPGHRDQVFTLALSQDGKLLASGSSDRTVKLWDLQTGTLVRDFPNPALQPPTADFPHPSHPGFVQSVHFTAGDKQLVSVGTAPRNQGYLAVWSVVDGKFLGGGEQPLGPIYSIALTAEGTALLGCGPRERTQTEANAVLVKLPGGE